MYLFMRASRIDGHAVLGYSRNRWQFEPVIRCEELTTLNLKRRNAGKWRQILKVRTAGNDPRHSMHDPLFHRSVAAAFGGHLRKHVVIGYSHFGGLKNLIRKYVFVNNSRAFQYFNKNLLKTIIRIKIVGLEKTIPKNLPSKVYLILRLSFTGLVLSLLITIHFNSSACAWLVWSHHVIEYALKLGNIRR